VATTLAFCSIAFGCIGLQFLESLLARRAKRLGHHMPPPGKVVMLARGSCHYIIDGATNSGPLVVLIPGFLGSTTYLQSLSTELVLRGRRVLRFDQPGRGWSTYGGDESLPHTPTLFVEQLAELLFAVGEGQNELDLMGYSLGAIVAALYASKFPRKTRSLVFIAPAGTGGGPTFSAYAKVWFHVPVVCLLWCHLLLRSGLLVQRKEWQEKDGVFIRAHEEQQKLRYMHEPALAHSMLNTLRQFGLSEQQSTFAAVGSLRHIPVQVIWGDQDTTVPFAAAKHLQELVPHAELWSVPGTGHAVPIELPRQLADKMCRWWVGHFEASCGSGKPPAVHLATQRLKSHVVEIHVD